MSDTEHDDAPITVEQVEEALDARCEAETTAGGNTYRCGLDAGHEGDHAFAAVDADDVPDGLTAEQEQEAAAAAEKVRIEKEWERVTKYLAAQLPKIYGESPDDISECMLCRYWGTPGFVPHIECPDDLALVLSMYTGMHATAELEKDYASEVCPKCAGHGALRTGSTVQGQTELPCPFCNSNGWVAVGDERKGAAVYSIAGNGLSPAYPPPAHEASALPATPVDEDPEVSRLRQLGYAVIPPMVVGA